MEDFEEIWSNEELQDRARHYALACKGDKHCALLMALDAGYDFKRVVTALGDDGPRVAFACILKGWIDRGEITAAGRTHLREGSDS